MADNDKSGDSHQPSDVAWTMVGAVLFGIPALVASGAATGWDRATAWLLEHEVLLPESADPLVTLPNSDGVGLDATRIVVAVGALAVLSLAIRLVAGLVDSGMSRRAPTGRR